jgi:hypothetical protein
LDWIRLLQSGLQRIGLIPLMPHPGYDTFDATGYSKRINREPLAHGKFEM